MSKLAHTVSRSVLLDAPPEQVWEAIAEPGALQEWLAEEVEFEPREGGEARFRFADGEERRGEVELVEEAERLAFRWHRDGGGPSRVEFVLEPVEAGTLLTVTETGLRVPTPTMAAPWAAALGRLPLVVGRLVLA